MLIVIATLLDWVGFGSVGFNGFEIDFFGLLGIFTIVFGLAIAAAGAIHAFAPQVRDQMPQAIMGFTPPQVVTILSFTVFLWLFSFITIDILDAKIGIHLGWIGGALATAGGIMESRGGTTPTNQPPTSF